jgi:hypothetical protein
MSHVPADRYGGIGRQCEEREVVHVNGGIEGVRPVVCTACFGFCSARIEIAGLVAFLPTLREGGDGHVRIGRGEIGLERP